MKTRLVLFISAFISTLLLSCGNSSQKPADSTPDWVMTKAIQEKLTPDSIITILKNGNTNFYSFKLTPKNDSMRVRVTAGGQYPMAAVLSCLDSRIPVERVFDRGIGDLFVARVAGNIANEDILGSFEFACQLMGAKVILVLGHEDCGAVKAGIGKFSDTTMPNLTQLVAKFKPVVDATQYTGDRTSTNPEFVHAVAKKNIELTIAQIRKDSPVLLKREREGKLKIIGGMYDLATGKITFY